MLNKSSEIGRNAPATNPAKLVHDATPVPAKVRDVLNAQSNRLPVRIRRPVPHGPDLILWIIIIMLLVRFAVALFAGK
jgi:hypothetical protein